MKNVEEKRVPIMYTKQMLCMNECGVFFKTEINGFHESYKTLDFWPAVAMLQQAYREALGQGLVITPYMVMTIFGHC